MTPHTPLYLLPFDHRQSYLRGMFHLTLPLTKQQQAAVTDSKRVIYEGFRHALGRAEPLGSAGIMIDEEYGAEILGDAVRRGYVTAVATEKSGADEFDFEYGAALVDHIERFKPTFAKALVRFNPEGDGAVNRRQAFRLKVLSDYCHRAGQPFMLELLVPATEAQAAQARASGTEYERFLRPWLMLQAIRMLQDAGVEPDVWKVEGLDLREDCEQVAAMARRDGREHVGCIVLGGGAAVDQVVEWLETAAAVPGFIGFAIGRTMYWDAIADYLAHRATRQQAATRIAWRFAHCVAIFEKARVFHGSEASYERSDADVSDAGLHYHVPQAGGAGPGHP